MSSTSQKTGGEDPLAAVKRRGLTIGHWLLIVIFVALCVDISIRIRAWRKSQESAANTAALRRIIQNADDAFRKASAELDRVRSAQKSHPSDSFERMTELLENLKELQRDPYERNIIWR
jgi:biopolymer transport protein ExbB/TolQ